MKIGLLCCFYGNRKYLDQVIEPWLNLKQTLLNLKIAVVHGQFKEYHENGYDDNDFETQKWINEQSGLDYVYLQNDYNRTDQVKKYEDEASVRNYGLQFLLKEDCDYIMLLDGDEIYTEKEINNCFNFIKTQEFIAWFNIEFKNLTFSDKTYIKGFKPPRIFKTNVNPFFRLSHLYYDNDPMYIDAHKGYNLNYKYLPTCQIPVVLCNPLHYTWLNDDISKKKIEYQEKHFAIGAGCSFKWDEKGLGWNQTFFRKTGQTIPVLYTL